MINKFQQGGAAPQLGGGILALIQLLPQEQLQLLMLAFAQWAQQKGVDIQLLQLNPQALELALGQFMQEMQAQQAQMARHGAKLQYIKSLKHQCAKDEELQYYKAGGSIGCKCVKKEKQDGEVKESALDQFKAKYAKGGKSVKGPGSTKQPMMDAQMKEKKNKFKNDYSSKRVKDSENDYFKGVADHKAKKGCGGLKMKKHQIGGTLEQLRKSLGL